MKGIILAGGSGTRLYPLTRAVSKQLLPVYDKPMVYYPLSTLMLAGIKEILFISTPKDLPIFEALFGDGSSLGMQFSYKVQEKPNGLPEAFILGEEFIGGDSVAMMLGDNILYGSGLSGILQEAKNKVEQDGGHMIFGYHVPDPERSGVVEFDANGAVVSIEEKPEKPKSHYAILGLYFFDNKVVEIAKGLAPSARGELEMVDLHKAYLASSNLYATQLPRGVAWLDAGLHSSLLQAGNFVHIIEQRQGLKIGCIEEVAYRMGYITAQQLKEIAQGLLKSGYGNYLLEVASE
ncbi:MAG: glucose-1-phosphate thymidylyltransferase RfbA [bacterium]|nr:glucose-1-phosphate thymidylyltransferase RfbA [bacterium]